MLRLKPLNFEVSWSKFAFSACIEQPCATCVIRVPPRLWLRRRTFLTVSSETGLSPIIFRHLWNKVALPISRPVGQNELLLGLMGRSGRQLWIEGHDAGTFRAFEYHTDTFFHEDFVKMFGTTFWQAIPPSNDPLQDKEEKLSRWGGETTTEYEPSDSS